MANKIQSGSNTVGLMNVNTDFEAQVALSKEIPKAGYAIFATENDAGSVTGTPQRRSPRTSIDDRLIIGGDYLLDAETFNYAAQNTAKYTVTATTMAFTFASGFMNLNSGAITTLSTGVVKQTKQFFSLPSEGTLVFEKIVQMTAVGATNTEINDGWFLQNTAITIPLDGVYFRITSAGIQGVINNNGTETSTGVFTFVPTANVSFKLKAYINNRQVDFYINDIMQASITATTGGVNIIAAQSLPLSSQIRITAVAASVGTTYKVGNYGLWHSGAFNNKSFETIKASQGNAYQGQSGGTMGSIANYANSANPTAAVPTNTTAALGTGLGGQFWETDTLAVTTDGIICSFQNPAGTVAVPGKNLIINGIWIDSFVQTALTGGGYNAQFSLAFGHTSLSLATTESATAKAPRRIPLGSYSVPAAATALTQLGKIFIQFTNPVVVYPGEFVAIAKKKIGTAPSAGVIAHTIGIDHYFE